MCPPLYSWLDEETNETFEVYKKTFDQSSEPPLDDELPEAERGKERKWKKLISGGIKVSKSPSWGPGKGHWLVLLGACAAWAAKPYLGI
jgi:hypothetical protein